MRAPELERVSLSKVEKYQSLEGEATKFRESDHQSGENRISSDERVRSFV